MRVYFSGKPYWSRTPTERLRRRTAEARHKLIKNTERPPENFKDHRISKFIALGSKSIGVIGLAVIFKLSNVPRAEVLIVAGSLALSICVKKVIRTYNDPCVGIEQKDALLAKLRPKYKALKAAWIAEKRGCAAWAV